MLFFTDIYVSTSARVVSWDYIYGVSLLLWSTVSGYLLEADFDWLGRDLFDAVWPTGGGDRFGRAQNSPVEGGEFYFQMNQTIDLQIDTCFLTLHSALLNIVQAHTLCAWYICIYLYIFIYL